MTELGCYDHSWCHSLARFINISRRVRHANSLASIISFRRMLWMIIWSIVNTLGTKWGTLPIILPHSYNLAANMSLTSFSFTLPSPSPSSLLRARGRGLSKNSKSGRTASTISLHCSTVGSPDAGSNRNRLANCCMPMRAKINISHSRSAK